MRTSRALVKQTVTTYAEALFEVAQGDGVVDATGVELEDVVRTVRAHVDLRDTLRNEQIPAETRGAVMREVFASFNPALVTVLGVMADRGEVELLSSVSEEYGRVAEERRNMVAVEVTTVVELNDTLRESIKAKLSADLGRGVVLREKVDPSIVGGIIISTGGRRLDASIASQLEAARMTLSTAHTGGDV